MADVNLEVLTGKLNPLGYESFMQAFRLAQGAGNRNLELAHWLQVLLQAGRNDLAITTEHFKLDQGSLLADLSAVTAGFAMNKTELPGFSDDIFDALSQGWNYATLMFGETQVRTGHILTAVLKDPRLARTLHGLSKQFRKIDVESLTNEHRKIWRDSVEENMRPMDGSGLVAKSAGGESEHAAKGTTALDRFAIDLTQRAASGAMDPIVGRDEEIRLVVDVLMRRRQNNPILTGEAGVGKTAVVEGFAQRIAAGDVPPPLKGSKLYALDIGLMQAGASMKGEFEQRLRSVIDQVQAAATPTILFIDEAHTLIGAGGAAGTGDAANLLKPALARGTLRTIAATTWSEYRQHIEKDPALTRRFQPINVGEPGLEQCCNMMRALLTPMEEHHKVHITDDALVAAVKLSSRYIPSRQLPDKAVSLLDTAAARVAISQNATPAAVEDARVAVAAHERTLRALERESDIGSADEKRIAIVKDEITQAKAKLEELEKAWDGERAMVEKLMAARRRIADAGPDTETAREELSDIIDSLGQIDPEKRMVYPYVDEQSVASVVSDWTGIPVGRMVKDEVQTVLTLADILAKRVIGQDHGLKMIAKRIQTNRAKLDNPNKPIGVFMLAGPSGVGKTETALALAEALYGGEQNMITINMSEFQEAHTVSTLKGAPPGYVGYGEGGRLTEAVRRRPYSVVLLDEVEKAHPDVHEIFFQVFDKGVMEDGSGRRIDFRNTLIILTTNAGTEMIMDAAASGAEKPDPEQLATDLKPHLLQVFPPALLGRIVTIPYYPLSGDMLGAIVRLQLGRIGKRLADNHGATFTYDDAVVEKIVSLCNDPDSGGRMVDNIVTNTLLPALSQRILGKAIAGQEIKDARVGIEEGEFTYVVD
ncbi:type VI secretion system ATPase TssH [Methylovirgula sp. 4M-Z18]|uniref:type VI secretion system ATPase TssH n=1 Tax=Methylovirgula sp. 4M-Z18 TaxID=2293567 RepID=UPI000E2E5B9F|nr:type VI secretion system ATPase TssH [Methylovirgula sp. 4M-Z18]RFB76411.1 type VI secretion system ATPase TssH [Methylovirgula sp. 4M-Z18]